MLAILYQIKSYTDCVGQAKTLELVDSIVPTGELTEVEQQALKDHVQTISGGKHHVRFVARLSNFELKTMSFSSGKSPPGESFEVDDLVRATGKFSIIKQDKQFSGLCLIQRWCDAAELTFVHRFEKFVPKKSNV